MTFLNNLTSVSSITYLQLISKFKYIFKIYIRAYWKVRAHHMVPIYLFILFYFILFFSFNLKIFLRFC